MTRYTVTGQTKVGTVAHVIWAEDKHEAEAKFLKAHPEARGVVAVKAGQL